MVNDSESLTLIVRNTVMYENLSVIISDIFLKKKYNRNVADSFERSPFSSRIFTLEMSDFKMKFPLNHAENVVHISSVVFMTTSNFTRLMSV